jgi:hypothetical protein
MTAEAMATSVSNQVCRACFRRVQPRRRRIAVTRHQSGLPGIALEFDRIEWCCPKCGEHGMTPPTQSKPEDLT